MYIGVSSAAQAKARSGSSVFVTSDPGVVALQYLAANLDVGGQHYLLSMVLHLRYLNAHTHWFIESAVITGRNIILFTLLADAGAVQKAPQIWNISFLFYLDKVSHDLLISQCRRLVELSSDLDSWNNGTYGHLLRMCTGDTLAELWRLWQLYVKTTTRHNFHSGALQFQRSWVVNVHLLRAHSSYVALTL
ncbi:hypothetical protein EDB19DRAFT_1703704 [Suillus lakei]|nr:hypothetical protein EDB19DRAFT_1703704 [Suillus lakei]